MTTDADIAGFSPAELRRRSQMCAEAAREATTIANRKLWEGWVVRYDAELRRRRQAAADSGRHATPDLFDGASRAAA